MLSTILRRSPAMLRTSSRGTTAAAVTTPAAALRRGLRTVTRFREEERPDVSKAEQQQQQQQPKAAPTPSQPEQQQMQQQQEQQQQGQMVSRRRPEELAVPEVMLPPSMRRFNETLNQMQREMDMMMNQFFGEDLLRPLSPFERDLSPLGLPLMPPLPSPRELASALGAPALIHMDFTESDKEYTLCAEVPGFSKDHIKASLSPDGVLTIKGDIKEDEGGEGKESKRRMTRFSTFTRSFKLPSDASVDGISACVENGVLHVTVPKVERKEKPHKDIPIK